MRAWKWHLAAFAAETGLTISVCHYPPGTSKWNKIEHRLFSFISMNRRGRPLADIRTIVELIAATTTRTGLTVQCAYDPGWYPTGERVSDADFARIPIRRHQWGPARCPLPDHLPGEQLSAHGRIPVRAPGDLVSAEREIPDVR